MILGGTTEARALAQTMAEADIAAIYSYAGRTRSPEPMPVPTRIGGFGGPEGLATYVRDSGITHIVDATHPFAQIMSRNAVAASAETGVPLIALTRPAWTQVDGDVWVRAPDMESAVAALDTEPQRIFLAIGRKDVGQFAARPQHHYLLRLVDSPRTAPPLPDHHIVLDKGPFDTKSDIALMQTHRIGLIVSKNSGGDGARAKLDAARALGLPVLMIDRPKLPHRLEMHNVRDVMAWLAHSGTERGV